MHYWSALIQINVSMIEERRTWYFKAFEETWKWNSIKFHFSSKLNFPLNSLCYTADLRFNSPPPSVIYSTSIFNTCTSPVCGGNKLSNISQTSLFSATSSTSSWGSWGTPRPDGICNPSSISGVCPAISCQLDRPEYQEVFYRSDNQTAWTGHLRHRDGTCLSECLSSSSCQLMSISLHSTALGKDTLAWY